MAESLPVSCPPTMVRLVRQSGVETDCVVAALSSLIGLTYNQTLIHCAAINPDVLTHGMTWKDTRKAARRAGIRTQVLRRFDAEEATGLLCVRRKKPDGTTEEHVALLWAGRVCDGNYELWLDVEDYCAAHGYKATSLLVRVN